MRISLLATLIEHQAIYLPSTIDTCCSSAAFANRTRLREEVLPGEDIAKKAGLECLLEYLVDRSE